MTVLVVHVQFLSEQSSEMVRNSGSSSVQTMSLTVPL